MGSDFDKALNRPTNPSSIEVHGLIQALGKQLHEEAGFVPIQEVTLQAGQKISPFTQFEMIEIEDDDNPGEISRLSVFIPAADSSKVAGKRPTNTFNNKGGEVRGNILKGRIVQISAFRPDEVCSAPSLSVKSYDQCEAIIPRDEESPREIRDFSFSGLRMRTPANYAWSQAEQSVADFRGRLGIETKPIPSAKLSKDLT